MPENAVCCQECGQKIGEYIERDGRVELKVGDGIFRDLWGWCGRCDSVWYWHESDQQMEKLLDRLRRLRNGV